MLQVRAPIRCGPPARPPINLATVTWRECCRRAAAMLQDSACSRAACTAGLVVERSPHRFRPESGGYASATSHSHSHFPIPLSLAPAPAAAASWSARALRGGVQLFRRAWSAGASPTDHQRWRSAQLVGGDRVEPGCDSRSRRRPWPVAGGLASMSRVRGSVERSRAGSAASASGAHRSRWAAAAPCAKAGVRASSARWDGRCCSCR